jgi:hypothetical protein
MSSILKTEHNSIDIYTTYTKVLTQVLKKFLGINFFILYLWDLLLGTEYGGCTTLKTETNKYVVTKIKHIQL